MYMLVIVGECMEVQGLPKLFIVKGSHVNDSDE